MRICSPAWPVSIEILTLGYYPAVFGTGIGFAGITVALLGRAHPVGILLAALLLGGMRAGAPSMQITANIPIEIIDVIQGLILLFLAAEVVIRRTFRIRAERVTPGELGTVAKTYGEGGGLMEVLFDIPVLGFVLQFIAYLIEAITTTNLAPQTLQLGDPDRPRRPVRDHERAQRHREHRDRGDDADGGVRRLHGGDASSTRRCPKA